MPTPVDVVEALLFASDTPLEAERIRDVLDLESAQAARGLVEELRLRYQERGLMIVEVGGGYRMVTRPELAPWLVKLARARTKQRLSRPALETLAIIAYKQPVSRPEVDALRGVNSEAVREDLLERRAPARRVRRVRAAPQAPRVRHDALRPAGPPGGHRPGTGGRPALPGRPPRLGRRGRTPPDERRAAHASPPSPPLRAPARLRGPGGRAGGAGRPRTLASWRRARRRARDAARRGAPRGVRAGEPDEAHVHRGPPARGETLFPRPAPPGRPPPARPLPTH